MLSMTPHSFRLNEQLQYIRPDGVKFRLHSPPAKAVLSSEGLGMPPLDYVTDRAPFQHGDTVRAYTLGPRPVQLVVLQNFCSRSEYWAGRAGLLNAIRPNRVTDFANPGKLLYLIPGGIKRQLDVMVDEGPGFQADQGGWRSWSFTEVLRFTAHDPAWYDPTLYTTSVVQSTGELVFPITFPIVFGGLGTTVPVTYAGTWLEYPTIVVTGPVTGPSIENTTTGKLLALATTIPAGMTATFVLRNQKTITRSDGLNLLPFLTSDSDLTEFALQPDPVASGGVNTLQISGSDSTAATSIQVRYYHRYIGI